MVTELTTPDLEDFIEELFEYIRLYSKTLSILSSAQLTQAQLIAWEKQISSLFENRTFPIQPAIADSTIEKPALEAAILYYYQLMMHFDIEDEGGSEDIDAAYLFEQGQGLFHQLQTSLITFWLKIRSNPD